MTQGRRQAFFAWDSFDIPNRDSWLDRIERLLKQAEQLLPSLAESEPASAEPNEQ